MPVHLSPVSRREFLVSSSAVAAAFAMSRGVAAAVPPDPNSLALFADTHVSEDIEKISRDVHIANHLRQAVGEVCAMKTPPTAVIINGDCAYGKGLPGDYVNLKQLIQPLRDCGIPLHLTMGNHDDRGPLFDVFDDQRSTGTVVDFKHVSIVETPYANLFLLDSMKRVNLVTGELGSAQLDWLIQALDAHHNKPAIVMAHHQLQFEHPQEGERWEGVLDTDDFFQIMSARSHVKAYIYGHTHRWEISQRDGIHLINLPPVAHVFSKSRPSGWVLAQLRPDGMSLQLSTIDPKHRQHGQIIEFAWR